MFISDVVCDWSSESPSAFPEGVDAVFSFPSNRFPSFDVAFFLHAFLACSRLSFSLLFIYAGGWFWCFRGLR